MVPRDMLVFRGLGVFTADTRLMAWFYKNPFLPRSNSSLPFLPATDDPTMDQVRNCSHEANALQCFRCRHRRMYPGLDRPTHTYSSRSCPWGDVAPRARGEPRPMASRFSDILVEEFPRCSINHNDPQFDDEHPTYHTTSCSPRSRLAPFYAMRAQATAPVNAFDTSLPLSTAPSSYSVANSPAAIEGRTPHLQAEARILTERSATLMARSRDFVDLTRITPAPPAFAYPSSGILRGDYEANVAARRELEELWRNHFYDVAVWSEALRRWGEELAGLQSENWYNHALASSKHRLQRDERELEALGRRAGFDAP
ncbi:hypothetical protein DOTSEDRAFT_70921 [Dothistroma septosporum NZE10]|uniref:Uncharacterized protein n=1 Tax=Dothistroma septosporum (strain NZE10 / CBS 128990) TaxID=675120 RepID=N1PRJ1_DOTSN|nr:hypothetical protein DOTSEDRAFT_70921 [Dothistroma septosporum NZE10]